MCVCVCVGSLYLAIVGERARVVVTLGVVGLGEGVAGVVVVVSWAAVAGVVLGWRKYQGSGGLTTP